MQRAKRHAHHHATGSQHTPVAVDLLSDGSASHNVLATAPSITWEEFVRTHASCPVTSITSAAQLRRVLAGIGMGSRYNQEDLERAMELNGGSLDFDGLLRVVRYLKAKFYQPELPNIDTIRAFAAVGGTDSAVSLKASVPLQDLKASCDAFGLIVDRDRLVEFDSNGNGSIEFDEFAALFVQTEEERKQDEEHGRFLGLLTAPHRKLKPSPMVYTSPRRQRVDSPLLAELLRPPPPPQAPSSDEPHGSRKPSVPLTLPGTGTLEPAPPRKERRRRRGRNRDTDVDLPPLKTPRPPQRVGGGNTGGVGQAWQRSVPVSPRVNRIQNQDSAAERVLAGIEARVAELGRKQFSPRRRQWVSSGEEWYRRKPLYPEPPAPRRMPSLGSFARRPVVWKGSGRPHAVHIGR